MSELSETNQINVGLNDITPCSVWEVKGRDGELYCSRSGIPDMLNLIKKNISRLPHEA